MGFKKSNVRHSSRKAEFMFHSASLVLQTPTNQTTQTHKQNTKKPPKTTRICGREEWIYILYIITPHCRPTNIYIYIYIYIYILMLIQWNYLSLLRINLSM